MPDQFSRTRMLLGGGIDRLARARVAIFGIGGVGSYAAEGLARAGVGALDLIDHDTVCESNINRQLIALHSTLGMRKTEVMRRRILDINPGARVESRPVFYNPDTAAEFDLRAFDYIVDAIDTVSSKLLLIGSAHALGVPIISSMGAGNKLDPTRFEVTDIYKTSLCPLARVMRRELKKLGVPALRVVYSTEPAMTPLTEEAESAAGCAAQSGGEAQSGIPPRPPSRRQTPGSVPFVPSVAGLILAGEVVKELAGRE